MSFPSISLGVLSWRAPDTLDATLASFADVSFSDLFGQRICLLQDSDAPSREVCDTYNFDAKNLNKNIGILSGFEALARATTQDVILLVENDFRLSASLNAAAEQIKQSLNLLQSDQADIVQLRSRHAPGEPFFVRDKYCQFFPDTTAPFADRLKAGARRLVRPDKARRLRVLATRFDDDAVKLAPGVLEDLGNGFHGASSCHLPWTNNPFLVKRRFFLETIIAYANGAQTKRRTNGFKNLEIEMNSAWWRQQNFKIVQAPGLFTHGRIGNRGY